MTKKWAAATERYKDSKKKGFKPRIRRAPTERVGETLEGFLKSEDGKRALDLLGASTRDICLGYSEAMMSRTTSVILDGEGLKTLSGPVDVAALFASLDATKHAPVEIQDALKMLKGFPESESNLYYAGDEEGMFNWDEDTLVQRIRGELDEIAKEAP